SLASSGLWAPASALFTRQVFEVWLPNPPLVEPLDLIACTREKNLLARAGTTRKRGGVRGAEPCRTSGAVRKIPPDSSDTEASAAVGTNLDPSRKMKRRRKPSALGANSTANRGYGARHQATRKALELVIAAGSAVCLRCGRPILPGQKW